MTWTNAFDVGACTVQVGDDVEPDRFFSGVLGKGETSAEFAGRLANVLTASVSADGRVVLNYISGSGSGPADGYSLHVVPSYSLGSSPIRASGFVMPSGVSTSAGAWSSDQGQFHALTGSGSAWSPDPAVLTDVGQAYWAVYMGAGV